MQELPWLQLLLIDLGIMSIPMASLLILAILHSQPQECRFSYPNTPESPESLPVSMVTRWEFRFLQVSGQVMPWSMHMKSVSCGPLLLKRIPVKGTFNFESLATKTVQNI